MSRVIPSGFAALDLAIGTGGYPRGRIVELYGPEGAGESTLVLHAVREAQRVGRVAYVASHDFDLPSARAIGVDTERLFVVQPLNGGQAFEIVETLVRSGTVDLVVVDTVAVFALNAHADDQARFVSHALRTLTASANRSGTTLICIGLDPRGGSVGGNALKFYASVRLDVRRIEGGRTRVKVVKNKCAPPFGAAEFDIREVST